MCQVSAKSKNRFFYLEFLNKLVGHHEKKPKNPKFSTSKSIFKPIRKFSRLTPNIKKSTLGVLSMCKFWEKSKNFFSTHPPSVTLKKCDVSKRPILGSKLKVKKLFSRGTLKEKEIKLGPHSGSPKGWSSPGDKKIWCLKKTDFR